MTSSRGFACGMLIHIVIHYPLFHYNQQFHTQLPLNRKIVLLIIFCCQSRIPSQGPELETLPVFFSDAL
jgi:hypothetical protein